MIRPAILKIDLGDRQAEAGRFNNNHPDLALSAVAQTYPEAPFIRDDFEKRKDRKLAELIYDPEDITEEKSPHPRTNLAGGIAWTPCANQKRNAKRPRRRCHEPR